MTRLAEFMQRIAADTYPEPRTQGHDHITESIAPEVAKFLQPGDWVLDVGCGQGPALEWFHKHGFEPRGIALNNGDVKHCTDLGFDVLFRDQNDIGYSDNTFECVWARHVIEHSIAPYFTLHEFHRVLVAGGILYVEVPAPDTSCRHETNQNHYSVMGIEMWKNLIVRSGFELLEVREIKLVTGAGPDCYFSLICKKL